MNNNVIYSTQIENEIENKILSLFLQNPKSIVKIYSQNIGKEIFADKTNKQLFDCIDTSYCEFANVDLTNLRLCANQYYNEDYQKIVAKAMDLTTQYPSFEDVSQFDYYLYSLKDFSNRRKLLNMCSEIQKNVTQKTDKELCNDILQIVEGINSQSIKSSVSQKEANDEIVQIIEDNYLSSKKKILSTGFRELDKLTGGFAFGELITIGADTGAGKTTLIANLVENFATQNIGIEVFSLEMQAKENASRLLSAKSQVMARRILNERLEKVEKERVFQAIMNTNSLPIYYNNLMSGNINEIVNRIRVAARTKNIKVAVIDFIQMLEQTDYHQTTAEFLSMCATKLKDVARSENIVVIVASQLTFDTKTLNHLPQKQNIKNSKAINEKSDKVLLIYRPENYQNERYLNPKIEIKNTAQIFLDKNRNGQTGNFFLGFDGRRNMFYDIFLPNNIKEEEVWSSI